MRLRPGRSDGLSRRVHRRGRPAGEPRPRRRRLATKGLYTADKMMQLHKSQDNHMVNECYAKYLEQPGSHAAHKLLHTGYQNRRRISGESLVVLDAEPRGRNWSFRCVWARVASFAGRRRC